MVDQCGCSGPQALVQIGKRSRREYIDAAEQMIGRNAIVEMELVEQPRLIHRSRPIIASLRRDL